MAGEHPAQCDNAEINKALALPEVAQQLAIGTFIGAATLAQRSSDPLQTLRERVTSKGGTTAAALAWLDANAVEARIVEAVHAAYRRAAELGDEFGRQ